MRYQKLGNTGLEVSEIGFGGGNNGGIMFRPPPAVRLEAMYCWGGLGLSPASLASLRRLYATDFSGN